MKNLSLIYIPYSIKLKKPFQTSRSIVIVRNGFILTLKSENDFMGIGECSPLPDFGSESFEEDEKALADFNLKLNINIDSIEKSIEENLNVFNSLPALKCGLELAILNLLCNEKNVTIPQLLNRVFSRQIYVNGVISFTNLNEALDYAVKLVKDGYQTLKVKVGRADFDEDFNTIKEIRKVIGTEIKLRIDANGKWNKAEVVEYLTLLEEFDIQYAEQPVNNFEDFIFLRDKVKIPLAADESIRSFPNAEKFISSKAVSFLVLKPMMLGGIIPTLKIADLAKENNIQTVVTSSFETVIGRMGVVNAAALVNNNLAHGLGVAGYFDEESIDDPFPVAKGKIFFLSDRSS
jgi:o-succinylbenzoate synthase